MNARYPNLELLEYKARVALSRDEEFLEIFEERKKEQEICICGNRCCDVSTDLGQYLHRVRCY